MIHGKDQLPDEATYPDLARVLRSGGALEVGAEQYSGSFARVRKGNKIVTVEVAYRDFAAVLKEMDSKARDHFPKEA